MAPINNIKKPPKMNDEPQPEYELIAEYFVMDKDPFYICTEPEKLKSVLQKKELPEIWYWVADSRIYWYRPKFKAIMWDQLDEDNLERLIKTSTEEAPLILVNDKELKKFLSAAHMIGLNLSKIGQMRKETVMMIV